MKILEFADLDTSRVKPAYRKVVAAIANGDFRAAQVRKLAGAGHGKLYRARLNDADRLIFCLLGVVLVRHQKETRAVASPTAFYRPLLPKRQTSPYPCNNAAENLEHVDVALINRAEHEIDLAAYVLTDLLVTPAFGSKQSGWAPQ
jgi:hypothetical protein